MLYELGPQIMECSMARDLTCQLDFGDVFFMDHLYSKCCTSKYRKKKKVFEKLATRVIGSLLSLSTCSMSWISFKSPKSIISHRYN